MLKKFGKSYAVDPRISSWVLTSFLMLRLKMLFKGMLLFRKRVFIGSRVKFTAMYNLEIQKGSTIESDVIMDCSAEKKVYLGYNSKIGRGSTITITSHFSALGKGFYLGDNSAIGEFSHIGSAGGVEIGNDVIMGSYVSFHSENHNYSNSSLPIRLQGVNHQGIKIGNNVWIGAKATFLDGSVVGNNSIVAAGAVVRGIFPDNVIIGGVPAKIIKKIYD